MRKEIYTIILAVFIGLSCGTSESQSAKGSVSGVIKNGGVGEKLTIEYLSPTQVKTVDSATIDENGNFSFDGLRVSAIGFYRIKKDDKSFITLIIDPEDVVKIESDWNIGIAPYTITGSNESIRLQRLNKVMAKMYMARDSLNALFQSNPGNQELLISLQDDYTRMSQGVLEFSRNFIREDPSSFACLAAAEQLDQQSDLELFIMIDKAMEQNYSSSEYYMEFHKIVAKLQMLSIGVEAPDIILPTPNGEVAKLSDLRGKIVLVDFWASWCKPCRLENPNVVKAFKKYNAKGFEVFGVSLDQNRENWIEAIEADGLKWTQVSDLQFWSSSVVKLYDIQGIPFAVLLDREGKIIAKNLRGDELEAKLEEILN